MRFILVGLVNTLLGLLLIWGAKIVLGASDLVANIAGYAIGVTVSFMLNKRWTFGFRGNRIASLVRFLIVFAVSYAANIVTVLGMISATTINPFWCQAFGVAPYSILLYIGCRCYVFPEARSPIRL